MPVQLSDLNRPLICNLPQMGEVKVRNVSWESLIDLLNTLGNEDDESARARFVDNLLSQMISFPELDALAISQIHSEDILVLVDCAANVMNSGEDLAEIDSKLPPRERLYRAIKNHHRKLNQQIAESIRKSSTFWSPKPLNLMGEAMLGTSLLQGMTPKWNGAFDLLRQAERSLTFPRLAPDLLTAGSSIQALAGALAATDVTPRYWQELTSAIAGFRLPEPYLSDSLRISGWNTPAIHTTSYELPPIGTYESEQEIADRSDQVKLERLAGAYDTLVQLEWLLRRFVADTLQYRAGNKWWKQRVPENIRTEVDQRKSARETSDSLVHDLADYLFVGEIRAIMCKKDNWTDFFALPFDNDKGTVEVMFNWIEPVRKDIAHSRPVSDDEYTQFIVAAQWLTRKMRRIVE